MKTHNCKYDYSIKIIDREKIKAVLGNRYAKQIQLVLNNANIPNSKGMPFTVGNVRQCFNRLKISSLAMKEINKLCMRTKKEQLKISKQLEKLSA